MSQSGGNSKTTNGGAILCVGQIVADVVVRPVNELPRFGQTDLVDDLRIVAGGCAANTACVLAKLGADVRIAGLVGADSLSDTVLREIEQWGVDASCVVRSSETPISAVIVLVDAHGERSFLYRPGGNEQFVLPTAPMDLFAGVRHVHVGGAMKLTRLDLVAFLTAARRAGCTTSLDTDWDPSGKWFQFLGPALASVDYLLTNEEEGRALSGKERLEDVANFLLAVGPHSVIIKRGAAGAVAATRQSLCEFPACRVRVFDTTCAGDAFAAGFVFALSKGQPIVEAVRLANAVGALATTRLSHFGVTSLDAVVELMVAAASAA